MISSRVPDQASTKQTQELTIQESFHSQFDSRLPLYLQRTSCGLASFFTAVQSLSAIPKAVDYLDFALAYIQSGYYTKPTLATTERSGSKTFQVPISYATTEEESSQLENRAKKLLANLGAKETHLFTRIDHPEGERLPAFSIEHGFDHRGIAPFLSEHNIAVAAELVIEQSLDLLLTKFNPNVDNLEFARNKRILLSVKHAALGYPAALLGSLISTHVICVHGVAKIGDEHVLLFTDPAFQDQRDAIQIRTVQALSHAYAGKGTILTSMNAIH